jgi:hypothetical protein
MSWDSKHRKPLSKRRADYLKKIAAYPVGDNRGYIEPEDEPEVIVKKKKKINK